jgi:uncharacterized protein (TIGR03083 family)
MDTTEAYKASRLRVTALLREADPDVVAGLAPCCPEWTVKDIAAHLAGVTADIVSSNLDGVGTDPWTEAQVRDRKDRSLDEVLDEWTEKGEQVEEFLAGGLAPAQMVFDMSCHEHDIRNALRVPGAHDADATVIALDFALGGVKGAYPDDLPPLRLVVGDRTIDLGEGEPETSLTLEPFEALRALTGRRSEAQLRAYDWSGDPTPFLPAFAFGPFHPAATDIHD